MRFHLYYDIAYVVSPRHLPRYPGAMPGIPSCFPHLVAKSKLLLEMAKPAGLPTYRPAAVLPIDKTPKVAGCHRRVASRLGKTTSYPSTSPGTGDSPFELSATLVAVLRLLLRSLIGSHCHSRDSSWIVARYPTSVKAVAGLPPENRDRLALSPVMIVVFFMELKNQRLDIECCCVASLLPRKDLS